MPSTILKGLLKVGGFIDWDTGGTRREQELPGGRSTIVKIVPVKDLDMNKLLSGLSDRQRAISGENLLDDPRLVGKIDKNKVYILEE